MSLLFVIVVVLNLQWTFFFMNKIFVWPDLIDANYCKFKYLIQSKRLQKKGLHTKQQILYLAKQTVWDFEISAQ